MRATLMALALALLAACAPADTAAQLHAILADRSDCPALVASWDAAAEHTRITRPLPTWLSPDVCRDPILRAEIIGSQQPTGDDDR